MRWPRIGQDQTAVLSSLVPDIYRSSARIIIVSMKSDAAKATLGEISEHRIMPDSERACSRNGGSSGAINHSRLPKCAHTNSR
jgi:hypothetical protein